MESNIFERIALNFDRINSQVSIFQNIYRNNVFGKFSEWCDNPLVHSFSI